MNFLKSKVKVLICVLTGMERTNWVNPNLTMNLLTMSRDTRYDVEVEMVPDRYPVDYARNCCVVSAREKKAHFLLMIDNDQSVFDDFTPLDILSSAVDKDVIGLPTVQGMALTGYENGNIFAPNVRTLEKPEADGDFFTVAKVGTGAMFLNHRVWEKIPGPWFKWHYKETGELHETDGLLSEDFYFCELARHHGFQVWVHARVIPHWKTCEVARLGTHIETLQQMATQANVPTFKWDPQKKDAR